MRYEPSTIKNICQPVPLLLTAIVIFVALTFPMTGSSSSALKDNPAANQDKNFSPQASTGTTSLFTITGSGAGTANGDYVSDNTALDTFYSYFIEVPAGLTRLEVDIFDADVGAGGAAEATAGRDRDRGGFDSTATYTLINPSGVARPTQFNTGSTTAPAGADNAWLAVYDSTGETWRDNFTTAAYNNNDGTANWATNWIETNDNNSATNGMIQITGGELRIQDDNNANPSTIEREANLSGVTSATLTFDFRTQNVEATDQMRVQVSNNGGGAWTTLETFTGAFAASSRSYNISTSIASNTRVRFIEVTGYSGSDSFFVNDFQIKSNTIDAGHWELRVNMSSAVTAGDDINAIGVRAHDGASGASGTELNVYIDSIAAFGVNPPASGTASRSYTLYPYTTSGCSCGKNDFDFDSNSGTTGSVSFTSRSGAFTQNYASTSMSANDAWRRDTFSGWTTDSRSVEYGIWQASLTVNSYLVGGTPNGNYANLYMSNFQAAANPPAANPTANSFRIYLPNDNAAAPVKPYLEQLLTYFSGPNPPVVGQTSRFVVTVRVVNPTPNAITFSAANLVTANVPGAGAVYAGTAAVSQGSIVSQPAVGGTGNITWNPGTVAAGATVLLSYRVDVTPTSAGQRIPVTATPASGNGTRAQYRDETGNATQARATFLFGPLCELAVTQNIATAIKLASFEATGYVGGVFLQWETGFEIDNLGFKLYRDESGTRVPLSQQIIAGSALVAGPGVALGAGRSYAWWDGDVMANGGASYWLEEIDTRGRSIWHGPFRSKYAGGFPPKLSQAALLSDAGRAGPASTSSAPVERKSKLPAASSQPSRPQSNLASSPAVKLFAQHEGWYHVTQPDLVAAGLNPNADPRLLQLFADGQEVPIKVIANNGHFDSSSAIEFYGMGLDSSVTGTRVYWLIAGTDFGLRIPQVNGLGLPSTARNFLRTVERKDRTLFFFSLHNGEKENFFGATVSATPVDQSLTLQHVDQSATAPASLEIALQGATLLPHLVRAQVNGEEAGSLAFDGQEEGVATLSIPQGLLREGANQVTLTALGGESDFSFVDYIRISYWHSFEADDDALRLTTTGRRQVTIAGFTSNSVRVLDITNPESVQELTGQVVQQGTGFAVKVTPAADGQRTLLALAENRAKSPDALSANIASNWGGKSNGADILVITHKDFAASVAPLVALRRGQGFSVAVADVEDIYDEFSFGEKSPQAIRDFLAFAKSNWKRPFRFVLLVGNASRDPKNYLGFGDLDFLPTKVVDTASLETASDDWFADFDNDGLAETPVGRLPVRTAEQTTAMVSKIIGYEQASPLDEALLYADSNSGFDFEAATAQLASLLPDNVRADLINRGQMDAATARSLLLEGIRRGMKVVNYSGHGSMTIWRDFVLTSDDAENLGNDGLPLFVMMTCLNGYFLDPGSYSLSESLMKAERGGAVAVWASSGITPPDAQAALNQQLFRLLFPGTSQSITLGEATVRAKAAINDVDVRRTWILFGDPTTRLR
ncbi:MAG TPA: C25 family cysteine peptidase [Blastocatellia bacterium]|nr:C25 family cysteine peptidase [Blastocatellia bacterium]